MAKKLTLEQIKERAILLDIEILSDSYKGYLDFIQCRCVKCGAVFKKRVRNLFFSSKKYPCPLCNKNSRIGKFKLTLNDLKEKTLSNNIEILTTTYKGINTRIQCKCKICGREWETSANSLVNNNTGCIVCNSKNSASKHSLEWVKANVDKSVTITSTEYININSKLQCLCNLCGHQWEASSAKLVYQKTKCPLCKKKNISLHFVKPSSKAFSEVASVHPEIEILSKTYKGAHRLLWLRCKKCYTEWEATYSRLVHQGTGCPKCARKQTKGEKYVQELLESLGIEFIMNDRKTLPSGKELDFYVPSFKLAIEINGEFWHSSSQERMHKNYHLNKTRECEALGIHLLHFWHLNELVEKLAIVRSMLCNALHSSTIVRVYARNCEVKEIAAKESYAFTSKNSMHGKGIAYLHLGLFYQGSLVSVMSFGKSRFDKSVQWEIVRFCNLLNYSVIGGASKLLRYFERTHHPKSLLSYANRRFAYKNTNLYEKLGFALVRTTAPNYFYYRSSDGRMFNRITFQRHKLERFFGKKFSPKLTEWQIMQKEGYLRIYDCGNLVYLKEYEEVS